MIRSLEQGGAERQLVTLARLLDPLQFEVTIVTFYGGGALAAELRDTHVRLITMEKQGRWDIWRFLLQLVQQLRALAPDALHGYLSGANLLASLLQPCLPGTRIVWGVRASNMDLHRYDWLSRLEFRLQCVLARAADLIIINSAAGHAYHLAHGFPGDRMVVIPNGIDTDYYRPDPPARLRLRAAWGIAEKITLIGLVGRLDPMKDHPTFLRAAALLARERPDVRFVCVGEGNESYARQLHQLADDLQISAQVIWAGGRTDMPAVYNALDLLTSSSSFGEGFSNVIGEAMACGVPCVVTAVGDSALIVGEAGIKVPPGDPAALAAGWRHMLLRLQDDRVRLAATLRERIVEQFSRDLLVSRTAAALADLC